MIKNEIRKDSYFDSVTLMVVSSKIQALEGIENAAIMMGTDRNRSLMVGAGLVSADASFTLNDTVIAISAKSEEFAQRAIAYFDEYISQKKSFNASGAEKRVKTITAAKSGAPEANFTVISVPGRFARAETEKALSLGTHVLLFSDNVSLEDEVALKKLAVEKGLLMMGPDCGTTIINGTALGFANVVRRGNIGLVAAAGTGLQEATVIIDCLGSGVSQALGTGGRDLKEAVGGMMMTMGLEALKNDPETQVIVILSKPPAESVMKKMLEQLKTAGKPVIACFLGGDPALLEGTGIAYAKDLETAARLAVTASCSKELPPIDMAAMERIAQEETAKLAPGQRYLRGLYSGGTLCYETMLLLTAMGMHSYSNIAIDKSWLIEGGVASRENTLLDMGEDFFTNGMPHPMIDFRQRISQIHQEAEDEETGVLLLDCVCGYGTHANPAGELAPAIRQAKRIAAEHGRHLPVIVSVCGTESDPQPRSEQMRILEEAGAIVMPCNAEAAQVAAMIAARCAAN